MWEDSEHNIFVKESGEKKLKNCLFPTEKL